MRHSVHVRDFFMIQAVALAIGEVADFIWLIAFAAAPTPRLRDRQSPEAYLCSRCRADRDREFRRHLARTPEWNSPFVDDHADARA